MSVCVCIPVKSIALSPKRARVTKTHEYSRRRCAHKSADECVRARSRTRAPRIYVVTTRARGVSIRRAASQIRPMSRIPWALNFEF